MLAAGQASGLLSRGCPSHLLSAVAAPAGHHRRPKRASDLKRFMKTLVVKSQISQQMPIALESEGAHVDMTTVRQPSQEAGMRYPSPSSATMRYSSLRRFHQVAR